MIYYSDGKIVIRTMKEEDADIIFLEETAQGWHPNIELFKKYYREQDSHNRYVFIGEYEGNVAGYTTLIKSAENGPFMNQGIPEVVDFNVFIKYQKKGIGNKILDVAENVAAGLNDKICLGVGLHSGYGSAQRIYVKRGYLFDGSGVWYKGKQLEQYADCCNDDDLVLFLSKSLR
ncbi:GNAT family N-acetyltransferase [Clostridium omnivorum]|uniref:N-acetyltransferase n=1 Tax=Clostridium omnivorum TaxID=1604902 RepID=A0ABQ5N938_9CLOT|nr:GNAT family N-acetyltransferase [Clostridium sp. E14]GLC31730.1 N-acetyltransferase [Clostridium sp. E14]